jgi:hypothetical protein
MLTLRRLQRTYLSLSLIAGAATSCGIPGIRPEGRTATVSGSAPASRADVYLRAKDWFGSRRFTITYDAANAGLRGYSTIGTEGDIETRAVVDFAITGSTSEDTSYRVTGHTERGRPPTFTRSAQNAPETEGAVSSLVSWLSCPSARWVRCP